MVAPNSGAGYTVLARRFRPQAFGDVVGQEHISQALRNAIRANRVAHAYLFTGARGVGKTSSARILAKALNCPTAVDGDPCNECEICRGISAGNDVDVIEIDGASNRGIDEIRALRASVNVKSMRTRYKVYIIDEVHMLTKEAFNALLKTLEEPPPGVKFVFCTTEPNRVPDTILSRCQRFDFGTIATGNIKLRLQQIAELEGVQVDDAAVELVARRAAGSMRDSQSLFDQLLAFGEQHITAVDVHRLLGTASDERLIAIVDTLVERNPSGLLQALHAALDSGAQLGELTDQLLFYLRDLMVIAAGANELDLLAVSSNAKTALSTQAKKWGLQTIVSAMQILGDTKARMQRVTYGRALAELGLIRIAMLENMQSLDSLIESLKATESPTALPSPSSSSDEKKNDVGEVHEATTPSPAMTVVTPSPSSVAAPTAQEPAVKVESTAAPSAGTSNAAAPVIDSVAVASASPPVPSSVPEPVTIAPQVEPVAAVAPIEPVVVEPQPTLSPAPVEAPPPAKPVVPSVSTPSPASTVSDGALSDDDILAQFGAPPDDFPMDDEPYVSVRDATPIRPAPTPTPTPQPTPPRATITEQKPVVETPAVTVSMANLPPANELWQRVLADITDMLKSHAKAVLKAKYPGPGQFEIAFSPKFAFSKRYCEKLESVRRLEDLASRAAGVPLKVSITTCDDDPDAMPAALKAEAAKQPRARVYYPEKDPFVSNVMNVFAAEVVKVEPILGAAIRTDDAGAH